MFLHRSNRAELLAEGLCEIVATPCADPMQPEYIVVQSQGMARYLAMRLAEHLGVWANARFPFPRALVEQVHAQLERGAERPVLGPDRMTWAIAAQLPRLLAHPAFLPIAGYLAGDADGERCIQLAQRLGSLFDDYAVYRDDVVSAWERGAEPEDWQAILWRAMVERLGPAHMAARGRALIHAIQEGVPLPGLPSRLCLFGISTLPPLFVQVFSALSQRVPVHVFLLSPCQEYWADLTDERQKARRLRQARATTAQAAANLHFDTGHPLLSSLGSVGREFLLLLDRCGEPLHGDVERYQDPGGACMLHVLQSDILHLQSREESLPGEGRLAVAPNDRSVEIHVCHSPVRELEVLHDQLLWLFEREGMRPDQVAVMVPDIETYAPLIHAVFGAHSGRHPVSFRVADRGITAADPFVGALFAVLDLLSGRFSLPELIDVLSRAVVRERFEIAEAELPQVRTWAAASGMRWGADADHRAQAGQPAHSGNTVRFGLDRLLLGLAMEGQSADTFCGCLPLSGIEGSDGDLLGRFVAYCETLIVLRPDLSRSFTVSAFRAFVLSLMNELLANSEAVTESRQRVRAALDELCADAAAGGVDSPISTAALRRLLWLRLQGRGAGGAAGFLAGGVTFCQMLPMRSIPFEVIALLGLNDDGFPRTDQRLGFDLCSARPRPGDRRLRDDDRYLFLEAILSARRKLYLSYVGRNIHDNKARPPSVLIVELLDTLGRTFAFDGCAEERVCVQHALSGYNPIYFQPLAAGPHISFASHLCAGAKRRLLPRSDPPFLVQPLPRAGTGPGPIELTFQQLEQFVYHPIRAFLQQRLALYLGDEISPLQAREPIEPDALQRYQIGDALFLQLMQHGDHTAIETAALASGDLPLGTPGKLAFAEAFAAARGVAALAERFAAPQRALPPERFELAAAGLCVRGRLDQLWPEQQVMVQYSQVGRKSELRLWARHVVANFLATAGGRAEVPRRSLLIGRSGSAAAEVWFQPLPDPVLALERLFALVEEAMRFPLPLLDGPSRKYVEAKRNTSSRKTQDPLSAAAKAFAQDFGPLHDPHVRLLYPSFEALLSARDGAFVALSEQVFSAMLEVRSVGALTGKRDKR